MLPVATAVSAITFTVGNPYTNGVLITPELIVGCIELRLLSLDEFDRRVIPPCVIRAVSILSSPLRILFACLPQSLNPHRFVCYRSPNRIILATLDRRNGVADGR